MKHLHLLFLLLFTQLAAAITPLTNGTPVTSNGEYSFPDFRSGTKFIFSVAGTFGSGTVTLGYVNAVGTFTAFGTADPFVRTTAGSATVYLPESSTAGKGFPALSLSGATSPSLTVLLTKIRDTDNSTAEVLPEGSLTIAKTSGLQTALDARNIRAQTNLRLLKFKKALGKIRSGDKENLRVICIGDSTTSGYGSRIGAAGGTPSGSAGGYDNCVSGSYPDRLAQFLTLKGLPAQQNGVFGKPSAIGYNVTIANDDPRWTVGSGWTQNIWEDGLGGNGLGNNTVASNVTFTPTGTFDRFEVWYTPFGTLTADIGGSTLATMTATGANTILNTGAVSCTRGTGTVTIRKAATALGIINGVNAYDSQNPSCSIIMAGSGGVSANFCANGQNSGVGFLAMNALVSRDLTIISLGLNDIYSGRTPAQYLTDMTAIVNACLSGGGSMIIVAPFPGLWTAYADYPAYLANLKTLSDSVGAVLIDPEEYFGNGTSFAAQSMVMADGVHPNKNGYAAIAEMIADVMVGN